MSYVSHLGASPRRGRRCWPFLELPDAGNEKGAMARDPLSFWRSRCFDLVVSTPSLTVPKYMEAQLQSNSQLRNSQSGNCLTSPNSRTYIYIYIYILRSFARHAVSRSLDVSLRRVGEHRLILEEVVGGNLRLPVFRVKRPEAESQPKASI